MFRMASLRLHSVDGATAALNDVIFILFDSGDFRTDFALFSPHFQFPTGLSLLMRKRFDSISSSERELYMYLSKYPIRECVCREMVARYGADCTQFRIRGNSYTNIISYFHKKLNNLREGKKADKAVCKNEKTSL